MISRPGLHIAEVVADQAARDGRTRVGVLGTRYTMDGPVYPRAFGRPGDSGRNPRGGRPPRRSTRIIFDELVQAVFTDTSRREYVRIIGRLADRGCDAVALVCTEIPMLVAPEDSPSRHSTRPGCWRTPPSTSPWARRPCRPGAAVR